MSKTFVIGDIHGAYTALLQCMERSEFDYLKDRLICLGDVCDRRPQVKECVEELLQIKNLKMILGNHDHWALEWMENTSDPGVWLLQGGSYTVDSYHEGVPEKHKELFRTADYYIVENKKLFVHGGIDYRQPINIQNPQNFLWDRSLVNAAIEINSQGARLTEFEEVYVGHTPTIRLSIQDLGQLSGEPLDSNNPTKCETDGLFNDRSGEEMIRVDKPIQLCNVWLMDTGAGWPGGRLSMMNVETKEVFQSDVFA